MTMSRSVLNISMNGLHGLSGQPVPGSCTLDAETCFLEFRWNFLVLRFGAKACALCGEAEGYMFLQPGEPPPVRVIMQKG